MFSCCGFKKSVRTSSNGGSWVVAVLFCVGSSFAQEANHQHSRTLVIGELVGRVDVREMRILTRNGLVSVSGSGNDKPFKVVTQNPKRLELKFNSAVLNPNNPRKVVYKFYESERALISALILDEVDFAILENETSALEVEKSNPHFLPLPVPPDRNTVKMISYNHRNAILKERKVRTALTYAIDRDHIRKKIILGGKAEPAYGPFDSDSPLYNSGMESYKRNPRKAMQLLREAGWRDRDGDGILDKNGVPFRIDFFYQKGLSLDEAISRQVKIDLIQIGVEVNPKPLAKSKINDFLHSGDFDAVLIDHTFEDNVQSLEDFFSANGARNYLAYRSRTFENYLRFYRETKDPDQKKTLIKSMQAVINRDQPVCFLYFKWWKLYLINVEKFANYRNLEDAKGSVRPFEQWVIRNIDQN